MFRFLYTLCDLLAGVSVLASIVAIFHWLLKTVNLQAITPSISTLDPFFEPLNALVELFIQMPPLDYGGHSYPTTQGVLGCLLTIAFFMFNLVSESLKAAEQKLSVTLEAESQKQRLRKIQNEEQKHKKQVTTNRRVYMHVCYDVLSCPTGASYLEGTYSKHGGIILESYGDSFTIEFASLNGALQYCLEASQAILSYYATLRPVDPQPPFQIGIHALDTEMTASAAMAETRRLVKFVGPNQAVFSQDVKALMDANGLGLSYRYQSVGIYAVEGGRQLEIFRLFFDQVSSSF